MLAPVIHILPVTTIRRERLLPVPGKVVVRKGQRLGATETVAEAFLNPEHLILDIGRGLGINPNQADRHIQCKVGDQIAEGDVIAGPVGLTRRVIRAPRTGRVMVVGSGQVLLELKDQPFELKAGFPGEVIELVPERGVILETNGSLIQGVWGNGRIDYGLLSVLAKSPGEELTPDQLDVSLRGSLVLAGYCARLESLRTAADIPLRGLILASLAPGLDQAALKLDLPIIVIEGFGQRPMNSVAYKLLTTNERREMALNAEPWDLYANTRPEIIIPLPTAGQVAPPREAEFFAPGQQVRVLAAPMIGSIGTLVEMRGSTLFPSGIRGQAAEIRFENGENVLLPLANLEVVA